MVIVVKRYDNRKLRLELSSIRYLAAHPNESLKAIARLPQYVNLEHLAEIVKHGIPIKVYKHRTKEDWTIPTLAYLHVLSIATEFKGASHENIYTIRERFRDKRSSAEGGTAGVR